MKKIILGLALLSLVGCAPTMIQATTDYQDFRNKSLDMGFKYSAEAISETTRMTRGGEGSGRFQWRANQIALEMCAKVAPDCIITKENNNVVKTIGWQTEQQITNKNKNIDEVNNLKIVDEKTKLHAKKKDTKYKEGTYYCWDPERKYTFSRDIQEHANLLNRCEKELQPIAIEITKDTYDKAQKIISDPSYNSWYPQHQQKLVDFISNSKEVIAHSPNRQQITKIETSKTSEMLTHDSRIKFVNECEKRYLRFSSEFNKCFQDFIVLENLMEEKNIKKNNQITLSKKSEINLNDPKFSKKCEGGIFTNGFKKGTSEFNDCIKREQKLATLEEQKKQLMNEDKNRKVQEKQELDQAKNKEEQIKVSKMKPEDRHAYTCSEKFGFKRSTDKFKDCIFEMYKAETELEKLELQKQVAKANAEAARVGAEAARAGAERQERLSLAQTEAAKMQAYALEQQAIASKTANNLILLETGLRMLSPAPAPPRTTTTCSFNGRFMNCF